MAEPKAMRPCQNSACKHMIPKGNFACRSCWRRLPDEIKRRATASYRAWSKARTLEGKVEAGQLIRAVRDLANAWWGEE